MGFAQWMRALDTVAGLVQLSGRVRGGPASPDPGSQLAPGGAGPLGLLEARLAGIVVAALKEAFDRDSARLELERSHIDAERARAEAALRAELRRQAAEAALVQLRLVALMAIGTWALSAALGLWLPGMRADLPRLLLAGGWVSAFGALGCAFAGSQHVSAWSAADGGEAVGGPPRHRAASLAPWLLIAALALTGASLLMAL